MNSEDKNSLLTPAEFLRLTGWNEADLLFMLEKGLIPFSRSESGGLLIEVDDKSLEAHPCAESSSKTNLSEKEQLAKELTDQLDEMINEAFQLALRWATEDQKLHQGSSESNK